MTRRRLVSSGLLKDSVGEAAKGFAVAAFKLAIMTTNSLRTSWSACWAVSVYIPTGLVKT